MIEQTIRTKLLTVTTISDYVKKLVPGTSPAEYVYDVFRISAPEGTTTPYIVINADDNPSPSDVLAVFDIDIDIYDYNENRANIRTVSQAIKNALHYEILTDVGDYETIRTYFAGRTTIKENDSTLVRVNMSFTGRATEKLT